MNLSESKLCKNEFPYFGLVENDCDDEHMAEVNEQNQTIDMSASDVIEMEDIVIASSRLVLTAEETRFA